MSFAFFQPTAHTHVERIPSALSQVFSFSYILVDELVLPSLGVTSITNIARTAIALPTRLLDGQITRSDCRHKPVLNGLGIYWSHPATIWVMNWTSGWERPSAGPEVNKQFTVANQIIFIDNTPAIIEIDLSRQTTQPSLVSEKEPGTLRFDRFIVPCLDSVFVVTHI